ncbi:MAG TPA: carbohydrate kinase family protein [Agriterribacter sp.]|nr:carbohydrate kinase family protein [Agriterribacter sp.]
MKKFDVSVIGELNVDFILNKNDSFPVMGKEVLAGEMSLTLGSSSAIFASNLCSLGATVAFLGKLGKDLFGELVLQTLRKSGVDITAIEQRQGLSTGATVVLNFGEDRAMVTHPGAMEYLTATDLNWEIIKQSRHLHFSSFFIQKAIRQDIGMIFKKAKAEGLTTSFDPQWDPAEKWEIDLENILPYVDVFLPNEKELLRITKCNSVSAAIEKIENIANTIVLKQGNEGSTVYTSKESFSQPAFLNDAVVDAIGAGDSFNAGFIYKFIQSHPLRVCQSFGNVMGAVSTTAAGGTNAFKDPENILKIAKDRFGYVEK